jgi:hypothetical protein
MDIMVRRVKQGRDILRHKLARSTGKPKYYEGFNTISTFTCGKPVEKSIERNVKYCNSLEE